MAAVDPANNEMAAVPSDTNYNTTWNAAHKSNPTNYKRLTLKPAGRNHANPKYGTRKYEHTTSRKQIYGISGTNNSISTMSTILDKLKDCRYIIRQHGKINVNNDKTHTLFIPDAGNRDLLTVLDELYNTTNDAVIWMIVCQIASAINCMHSKKIKHLDIKCENIVVDNNYNIVLIDWEAAQLEDPCIYRGKMTMEYVELTMLSKIADDRSKEFMFNGYRHDIYTFTCILFLIIMQNTVSEAHKTIYIKIIKYILSYIKIKRDEWLCTLIYFWCIKGSPIIVPLLSEINTIMTNNDIKKHKLYVYFDNKFDTYNYNPKTDKIESMIIQTLQHSLELSLLDFSNFVNENWLAREASLANRNDSWLVNEQYSQSPATPPPATLPPANQPGGARFHKKHTRRKYQHSRKSFSRTKKH
jgi:serine/threonine protein kinase